MEKNLSISPAKGWRITGAIVCLAFHSFIPRHAHAAPGAIVINRAIELQLTTQPGVNYALQSSTNLNNWVTEETIPGGNISATRLRSITNTLNREFRLAPIPSVIGTLSNQTVSAGNALSYTFPTNIFSDSTDGTLMYQATLSGGSNLPAWLTFAPAARTFSGTPGTNNVGVILVDLIARNQLQVPASVTFAISVLGAAPAGFVLIPAGSFAMGDTVNEGFGIERPVHTVFISPFYMKATEVKKSEWDTVATYAASHGYDISPAAGLAAGANYPVNDLSWIECAKYANAKSEMDGLTPVYTISGNVFKVGTNTPAINFGVSGYRLPTEAEWEKAARGGLAGKRFPWGDTLTHSNATYYSDPFYSYDLSSTRGYHPVYQFAASPAGSYAPNAYGLYDMTGNVWEWCSDWAVEDYYANSPTNNPTGPVSGSARVLRGGAWFIVANLGRNSFRYYADQGDSDNAFGFGFRLARNIGN